MQSQQVNIALISNDQDRIQTLSALLKDQNNKMSVYSFMEAGRNALFEEPLDLIILDCTTELDFDYRKFDAIRSNKKLNNIPFIFLIENNQDKIKRQIYKKAQNKMLIEPLDKFAFISTIAGALHLSQIERSNLIYKDIIDGEKKLISYLDDILEMNHIAEFETEQQLIQYLQFEFVKRLELTLAVETALFTNYNSENDTLMMDIYDSAGKELVRRQSFRLENSTILKLINHKLPHIFTIKETNDYFIQELEESFGYKIESLLFVPVNIFHRPRAAIILINKLYRNDFSESDLAFTLIAAQKISFQLEKLYLSNMQQRKEKEDGIISIFGNENKIFQEWSFYQQIMSSVNFGMIVFDSNYKIEFINKEAEQILKLSQRKQAPKILRDIFEEREFNHIKSLLSTRDLPIIREEIQLSIKNLPSYFIGFSIYVNHTADKQQKFIFVFSEITQTKRIQAEIIRMDRMASLGVLSSGIAHEIRNPLAGIKAMVQTLEEEMEKGSPQLEYIERILRQVNRLDDLLKAFFSYARPQRPDPNAQQIKNIISEVLPLFKRKMQDKNIVFKEYYAEDLYHVFVDSNQIQQVFFNLVLNAIDAMPEGGQLVISAENAVDSEPMIDRRHRLPSLLSNNFIEITVQDNGLGMPKDIIDKVFNPFFTTKTNGTGLGLSIVYQIIKEHGGQIEVFSEEQKGTTFKILLPALEKFQAA